MLKYWNVIWKFEFEPQRWPQHKINCIPSIRVWIHLKSGNFCTHNSHLLNFLCCLFFGVVDQLRKLKRKNYSTLNFLCVFNFATKCHWTKIYECQKVPDKHSVFWNIIDQCLLPYTGYLQFVLWLVQTICGNHNVMVTLGGRGLARWRLVFAESAQQAMCIERPIIIAIEVKKHAQET